MKIVKGKQCECQPFFAQCKCNFDMQIKTYLHVNVIHFCRSHVQTSMRNNAVLFFNCSIAPYIRVIECWWYNTAHITNNPLCGSLKLNFKQFFKTHHGVKGCVIRTIMLYFYFKLLCFTCVQLDC